MEGAPQQPNTDEQQNYLPTELQLTPWRDELVEQHGFGPRSMYVEMCWLPTLGPTATWLYRRLGTWAEFNPDGTSVDTADLAVSLGLGNGLSRSSGLGRAVDRLIRYDAARWAGRDLQVRTALGALPLQEVLRLSPRTARLHEEMTRRPGSSIPGAAS